MRWKTACKCTYCSGTAERKRSKQQAEGICGEVYPVTDYINNHFAEDLSLEGVASQAGFSKYHFSRLFKQYTDSTFYKYLNQKRIEFAKTLLQDPGVSVTEVAFKSGFSSLSAFLRMFKLMNNCTPTEFREMYDRKKMGN